MKASQCSEDMLFEGLDTHRRQGKGSDAAANRDMYSFYQNQLAAASGDEEAEKVEAKIIKTVIEDPLAQKNGKMKACKRNFLFSETSDQ